MQFCSSKSIQSQLKFSPETYRTLWRAMERERFMYRFLHIDDHLSKHSVFFSSSSLAVFSDAWNMSSFALSAKLTTILFSEFGEYGVCFSSLFVHRLMILDSAILLNGMLSSAASLAQLTSRDSSLAIELVLSRLTRESKFHVLLRSMKPWDRTIRLQLCWACKNRSNVSTLKKFQLISFYKKNVLVSVLVSLLTLREVSRRYVFVRKIDLYGKFMIASFHRSTYF